MTDAPDGYQRLYLGLGRVAHLVPVLGSPNSMVAARCGAWPGLSILGGYWFGTGSWKETQQLALLPLCKSCERLHRKDMEEPTSE